MVGLTKPALTDLRLGVQSLGSVLPVMAWSPVPLVSVELEPSPSQCMIVNAKVSLCVVDTVWSACKERPIEHSAGCVSQHSLHQRICCAVLDSVCLDD